VTVEVATKVQTATERRELLIFALSRPVEN